MGAQRRTRKREQPSPPPEYVARLVEAARDKKAVDILLLDVRQATDVADFFLLCTAEADIHARAILDGMREALLPVGRRPWHVEGEETLTWVLVDFVDVVVHIFREDARRFYALEEMWADAPRVPLPEERLG